jgi:hypothetical protein
LAEDQFQHSCSGAKLGAIPRHWLFWFIGVLRDCLGAGEDREWGVDFEILQAGEHFTIIVRHNLLPPALHFDTTRRL